MKWYKTFFRAKYFLYFLIKAKKYSYLQYD